MGTTIESKCSVWKILFYVMVSSYKSFSVKFDETKHAILGCNGLK